MTEVKPAPEDQLWPRVLEVAAGSMGDRMRTEHLVFESFDGRTLKLSLDQGGADVARYLSRETDRLVDLVKRATGRTVRIELDTGGVETSRPPASGGSGGSGGSGDAGGAGSTNLNEVSRDPLVQKALELFDATIVSVENIERDR